MNTNLVWAKPFVRASGRSAQVLPQGSEGGMRVFCYTAIETVSAQWRFTRRTGASIGNPEARPLSETHIPPVLSTTARSGAFSAPPEITSFFLQRHKGLAMAFSCQEA